MANRILWPANFTVEGAAGYATTVRLYGIYGQRTGAFWPEKDRCENGDAERIKKSGLSPAPWSEDKVEENEDSSNEIVDFRDLVRRQLNDDVTEREVAQLITLQEELINAKSDLFRKLDAAKIKDTEFLIKFRELVVIDAQSVEKVLGSRRYQKLFGSPPESSISFIDDRKFYQEQSQTQFGDDAFDLNTKLTEETRVGGTEPEIAFFAEKHGLTFIQARDLIKRFGNDHQQLEDETMKIKSGNQQKNKGME